MIQEAQSLAEQLQSPAGLLIFMTLTIFALTTALLYMGQIYLKSQDRFLKTLNEQQAEFNMVIDKLQKEFNEILEKCERRYEMNIAHLFSLVQGLISKIKE